MNEQGDELRVTVDWSQTQRYRSEVTVSRARVQAYLDREYPPGPDREIDVAGVWEYLSAHHSEWLDRVDRSADWEASSDADIADVL